MAAPAIQPIDLKNLKPREVVTLSITVLALIGFVWYTFDYKKQTAKKTSVEKRLREVEGTVASFLQAVPTPEQVNSTNEEMIRVSKEITDLNAEISNIKAKMSGKSVNILQQLKKDVGGKGTILRSFKTSEKSITQGSVTYKAITIQMKVHSEYSTVANLVKRLENIPAVLSLKSLQTERVDEILPLVETTLQIELFVF